MWRHKNWAKQRSEFLESHQRENRWGKTRQLDYEAGADAMLEALRNSEYAIGAQRGEVTVAVNGTWVFIPEEANNEPSKS